MIRTPWRDALALAATVLVLLAGAIAWLVLGPDPGITIVERDGRAVVGSVVPGSEADLLGVTAGAVVQSVDNRPIGEVAAYWAEKGMEYPVDAVVSSATEITVLTAKGSIGLNVRQAAATFEGSLPAFLLGLAILLGGGWWLTGGRAASGLQEAAVPMVVAWALPLLVAPLVSNGAPVLRVIGAVAPPLAVLLFGDAILSAAQLRRRVALLGVASGLAVAAATLMLLPQLTHDTWSEAPAGAWWAILLVPSIPAVAAAARRRRPDALPASIDAPGPGWLVGAAGMPAVAMLPVIADPSRDWMAALVTPAWLAVLVGWRSVSRRIAGARLQRDLVVTVTEAERSRLAAELHDVALQELTLLVRRLDATGDASGAAMARSLSDRLRELCGELHLPILDELGAGAALEWLVGQVASATDEDIRLDRSDPARPPAGVELAIFRVAQEAIANAVKHGGPPIIVRYVTTPAIATLSIDDRGTGLSVRAGRIAPRPGHYGLTTMQQRADQIGALLAIRAWPGGGTRVSLEWRAP